MCCNRFDNELAHAQLCRGKKKTRKSARVSLSPQHNKWCKRSIFPRGETCYERRLYNVLNKARSRRGIWGFAVEEGVTLSVIYCRRNWSG